MAGARRFQPSRRVCSGPPPERGRTAIAWPSMTGGPSDRTAVSSSSLITMGTSPGSMRLSIGGLTSTRPLARRSPITDEVP
jgi:hypothetical protein